MDGCTKQRWIGQWIQQERERVANLQMLCLHHHPRLLLPWLQELSKQIRDHVEVAERALLYSLGFNLDVGHPAQLAIDFLQSQYNAFLPEDGRVGADGWAQQVRERAGPAYDLINQLQNVTWSLGLLRCPLPPSSPTPTRMRKPLFFPPTSDGRFQSRARVVGGRRSVKVCILVKAPIWWSWRAWAGRMHTTNTLLSAVKGLDHVKDS